MMSMERGYLSDAQVAAMNAQLAALNGGPPQWEGTLAQGLDKELARETFGPFDGIANVTDGKYLDRVKFELKELKDKPPQKSPHDVMQDACFRMLNVRGELDELAALVAGPAGETSPAPGTYHGGPTEGLVPNVLRLAHNLQCLAADMEATIRRVRASL